MKGIYGLWALESGGGVLGHWIKVDNRIIDIEQ